MASHAGFHGVTHAFVRSIALVALLGGIDVVRGIPGPPDNGVYSHGQVGSVDLPAIAAGRSVHLSVTWHDLHITCSTG